MSTLIKKDSLWYILVKKGKNKLLDEHFQKSKILANIGNDIYQVPIEFSKFSQTIQSPIQFIRFLETLLYFKIDLYSDHLILLPAIKYIESMAFDTNGDIIKCPIEMMFSIIYENIKHIQNSIELFKLINALSQSFYAHIVQMGLRSKYRDIHIFTNVPSHILYLCAKYDFKEYFIFMLGENAKTELYDAKLDNHLLLTILILNNSKQIFYYLLSNAIDDDLTKEMLRDDKILLKSLMGEIPNDCILIPFAIMEEIPPEYYHKEIDSDVIKQIQSIFYSIEYEEYIDILFNINRIETIEDDGDEDFSYIRAYDIHNRYWRDTINYVKNNDKLITLDENMVIQLLQIYKYMIRFNTILENDIFVNRYIRHILINALNMSIRNNYYDVFRYLSKNCSDILPINLMDSIAVDVKTIIKEDNIEFIERLHTSKFISVHGFSQIDLFNDHIKKDIACGKLNNTIVSIEMMDFIYAYFGEKYRVSHLLFNMCGNLETLMHYLLEHTHIESNHLLKMIQYNCTLDDIHTVFYNDNDRSDHNKIFSQGIIGHFILFSIVFKRDDIYEYLTEFEPASRRRYGYVNIFQGEYLNLYKGIDIDYFISKLKHLVQNKIIDVTNNHFIVKLIELCIIDIRFIKVVNAIYDCILEYKLYIKPYMNHNCEDCHFCINISNMSDYLISNVMHIGKITPYLDDYMNDYCTERGLKYIATICKVFCNNYKKFFPIYEKCNYSEIKRFEKIEIIGKDFIEKYLYYMRLIYKELLGKKIKARYIPECILSFVEFDIHDYIESFVEYDDPNCTRHNEYYRRYGVCH